MPFVGVTQVFEQVQQVVKRLYGGDSVTQNLLLDIRDSQTPMPLGDAVFAVVGAAQTVIHAPAGTLAIQIRVEADAFLVRVGDQNERTIGSITSGSADITISGHGYDPTHDAEGPVQMRSTGNMPAPVVSGELYFIHAIDENTIRLHNSHDDAHDHVNPIVFTGTGSGTITLGGALVTPAATDPVGDSPITITAGATTGPPQSRFEVGGSATSDHTITVKGSGAGARLLYWFIG